MLLPLKAVILCFVVAEIYANNKISFKNVNIQLSEELILVTSSADLKNVVPPGDHTARVYGAVPVLYENSVVDLQDVRYLQFNNVSLRDIHSGAFVNLPSLTILSVDDNNIGKLRKSSFSYIKTEILSLKSDSISTLQPGAFRHSEIDYLSLQDNKISKIPRGLFKNVTVNIRLTFDNNDLREIEDGAFLGMQGQRLEELYLAYNKLEEINPVTFNFPNLRVLHLNNNLMKVLRPGDLQNLPKLRRMWIQSNRLKEIAGDVFSNSKISDLYLEYNEISSVSSRAFDNMVELSWMEIRYNNLTKWDANWFRNTPKLFYLRFENNKIQEIPDNAFQNLQNPYYLNLQNNKIAKISSNLGSNFNVQTIDFSGNKLKCVGGNLQETFRNVGYINFYGNPWDDNCQNRYKAYYSRSKSKGTAH